MCVSCGCDKPDYDYDDPRHITKSQLLFAAKAANLEPWQVAANIAKEFPPPADEVVPDVAPGADLFDAPPPGGDIYSSS